MTGAFWRQNINCINVYVHKVLREVFGTEINEGIAEGTLLHRDTRWRSWSRHCVKSRKVAVSIPRRVTDNPSDRTMALGLTQPLTEMSTRNISWGVNVAGV
jgi:hypothetical protein